MSEESGSVKEEICVNEDAQSCNPEEWIKWFEQFKDEKGDWILDNSVLEMMTVQFTNKKKKSGTDSSEEIEEQKIKETEGELEQYSDESHEEEDIFVSKLHEFTDFARDYLASKKSTLIDCNRPYRPSNPNFWFYKEFREYLQNQGFIEDMVDVLVKMFDMHPELPDNPLSFIRDNYGISQKEEARLIAEWSAVTKEMVKLEEEGKALEKRIKWQLKQPRDKDSTSADEQPKGRIQRTSERKKSERKKSALKKSREKHADDSTEESSFHWECSDPSSLPSFYSPVIQVGSEISHVSLEEIEEQQAESSITPEFEFDDFKRKTEESSSSLDAGSLKLE